jgi:hypothetical protein
MLLFALGQTSMGRSISIFLCTALVTFLKCTRTILLVSMFAMAFAFVESSVVVYLRQISYPEGFSFPLKPGITSQIGVEVSREIATIVMLLTMGMIAGTSRWQQFSYFLIGFGVWDIFYYVWLKIILDWPGSLLDWDILFLLPIPWIGPVIAPMLVSLVMIAGGVLLLRKDEKTGSFHASRTATVLVLLGSAAVLLSFLLDTDASLRFQYPKAYHYELLFLGMACYAGAFIRTARRPTTT